nr:ubiquitin hydrolase [Tanacetum cinerariifolium]
MPTKIELTLEQSQQGVSNDVLNVVMDPVMQCTSLPIGNKMLQVIPTASEEDSTVSEKSFPLLELFCHCLAQVKARLAEHRNRELKYYEKIRVLEFKVESRANCIKSLTKELELIKKEKECLDSKLAGFQTASKDLDNLLESQRSDKNKEGPTKSETDKVETVKKPAVKYAELYIKPSKGSKVRGNQRNWNNLKSQQLGENFVMKNKACFNCGHFDHLSYDCGLGVKKRRTCLTNTHKSIPSRQAIHRPYRPPMRPTRPNTNAATRSNVNNARPQTTQDLMVILIQRVKRLERELKARTSHKKIHKVDRGRSRSVMAWVPKKV